MVYALKISLILSISTILLSLTPQALAKELSFDGVDKNDLELILKDFSSLFAHTTVSPASSLGKIFGIEVGAIVGAAKLPGIQKITREIDPENEVDGLPHAALMGAFSVPLGVTFEANLIPEVKTDEVSFENVGLAVKWTFSDVFLDIPMVDLAFKGALTKSELSFGQTIDNASVTSPTEATIEYETTLLALTLMGSVDLVIVEPYAGIGLIKTNGEIGVSATNEQATIFDPNFKVAQSAKSDFTGMQFFVGAELNLLLFRLGAEYSKIFDADRYSFKASLAF